MTPRRLLLCGLVVAVSMSVLAAAQDLPVPSCTLKKGSYEFDLSKLAGAVDLVGRDSTRPTWDFRMNVCSVSNYYPQCGAGKAMICQADTAHPEQSEVALGFYGYYGPNPTLQLLDKNSPAKGLKLIMTNGDKCADGQDRVVHLSLPCGSALPTEFSVAFNEDTCTYNMQYASLASCPTKFPAKVKLSGGTIFLIIVVSAGMLYLILGLLYNCFSRGMTGLAACPHREFWGSIPDLCFAGCAFSWAKVKGICGGQSAATPHGTYETNL